MIFITACQQTSESSSSDSASPGAPTYITGFSDNFDRVNQALGSSVNWNVTANSGASATIVSQKVKLSQGPEVS